MKKLIVAIVAIILIAVTFSYSNPLEKDEKDDGWEWVNKYYHSNGKPSILETDELTYEDFLNKVMEDAKNASNSISEWNEYSTALYYFTQYGYDTFSDFINYTKEEGIDEVSLLDWFDWYKYEGNPIWGSTNISDTFLATDWIHLSNIGNITWGANYDIQAFFNATSGMLEWKGVMDNLSINNIQSEASYIIWTNGTHYFAMNGETEMIEFSGTDAQSVIQAAINALSEGGKIFIKRGNYTFAVINLKSNISLIGEKGTIFYGNGNGNIIGVINVENVTVQGITIKGTNDTEDAITVFGASNVIIRDCIVGWTGEEGIFVRNSNRVWIINNIVTQYGSAIISPGIDVKGGSQDIFIIKNVVYSPAVVQSPCIEIRDDENDPPLLSRIFVIGNSVMDDFYGIFVAGATDTEISKNMVYNIDRYGIYVTKSSISTISSRINIHDNIIKDAETGIYMYYGDYVKVTNNIIYNTESYGIYSQTNMGDVVDICENLIISPGGSGMGVYKAKRVSANTIISPTLYGMYCPGSNMLICDNYIDMGGSSNRGIYIYNGVNNSITNNFITNSAGYGIAEGNTADYNIIKFN
ncbi:MAG: hypothetical protein DRN95_06095, partial [Candidatus Hydrothermarchaeota archaeon]